MNGRAYDPLVANILSPDPILQFPESSQGFQRYSYCSNNPLKYTDPTGYDEDAVDGIPNQYKQNEKEWQGNGKGDDGGGKDEGDGGAIHSTEEAGGCLMGGGRGGQESGHTDGTGGGHDPAYIQLRGVNIYGTPTSPAVLKMKQDREDAVMGRGWYYGTMNVLRALNPLQGVGDAISEYMYGTDPVTGDPVSSSQASSTLISGVNSFAVVIAVPELKFSSTPVTQYSLRAAKSGFYPVMVRGFANLQEMAWLEEGDVCKFGITQNPATRYSQTFLDNTGAGLKLFPEFIGTRQESAILENMKLNNYIDIYGELPFGNKVKF
jgi:hypothetical protein